MNFLNFDYLKASTREIKEDYSKKTPFRWTVVGGAFRPNIVDEIVNCYPDVHAGSWDNTTYVDQKNKFSKTKFEYNSIFGRIFEELNSKEFTNWLESITNIENLISDPDLFGGGLHQSIRGAFLNVHVDYNFHPVTRNHRRVNVIIYMNKDWREEYEGYLELWDFTCEKAKMIEKIAPTLNQMVIFETNEISFHGHPKPLATPIGISRKSLATYYYTSTRPENEIARDHNTIYMNTEGFKGQVKRISSASKALLERITGSETKER